MRTQRANDSQKVLEDMERERKEMEEMFTIKAGEVEKLREKDVLSKNEHIRDVDGNGKAGNRSLLGNV